VRFGSETRMAGGTVVDVSEGGMRVESSETFPVHSVLIVFVQFPRHAVRLRARVAWSGGGEGGSPAMGLSFTQAEPALAKAYNEWLAEIKQMATEADAAPEPRGPAPPAGAAASGAGTPAAAPPAEEERPAAAEPPGPVRRRLESRQGQAYDILFERQDDGWRLTVFQLPRQVGVKEPDLQADFETYAAAQKALTEFVRLH
jgi:hypothetical protein